MEKFARNSNNIGTKYATSVNNVITWNGVDLWLLFTTYCISFHILIVFSLFCPLLCILDCLLTWESSSSCKNSTPVKIWKLSEQDMWNEFSDHPFILAMMNDIPYKRRMFFNAYFVQTMLIFLKYVPYQSVQVFKNHNRDHIVNKSTFV